VNADGKPLFTDLSRPICRPLTAFFPERPKLMARDESKGRGATMIPVTVPEPGPEAATSVSGEGARADLHCHSSASEISKLGIQRGVGLPECATPPEEVYRLAKRRGMDFVTITDHDTIAGCLAIADRRDVFISEELTAWFRGEPQAVHVLCYGITPDDHEWLQAHSPDVEACAEYLHARGIACALAHPFYAVEAPLTPRHRRRLAELFPIWEVRNGSRARELNMPAAVYIETHGGTGIGGSDDHAGVDIGRTFTATPPASSPEELLDHIRAGRAVASGEQGSAAKWAHSAIALAARAFGPRDSETASPDPGVVLRMVERVLREGDARHGEDRPDLGPADARSLLHAWLDRMGIQGGPAELLELMQDDEFLHSDLARRSRGWHERQLKRAVAATTAAAASGEGYDTAIRSLFDACVPAVPYVAAATFLGREKAKLAPRGEDPRRVALVVDAIGSMHGVSHTLERIRELGVPGFEVEVVGTDPSVDRRLPAVAEVEVPFYAGLRVGIPSLPALVETLAEGRYDLVHLASPGPAGIGAALAARIAGVATVGSYHTELAAYAGVRSGDPALAQGMAIALSLFYRQCAAVLSPSPAADGSLERLGIEPARVVRWGRGVDSERFNPSRRDPDGYPGVLRVLYAGRLTKEKGAKLLAEAFLRAHADDPRLHLLLAGGGPEEEALRDALGPHATFLGWLEDEELARAYASSDIFLFASCTDTFGQVIIEAQSSGVPVVAVREGGPASLIRDGETGRLCAADANALADAVVELAASPVLRRRLARPALAEARTRTWPAALEQLAAGYRIGLAGAEEPRRALELAKQPDERASSREPAPAGGGVRAA
jgi:glycosyltransferase involved in cell wall biosynthesis/predicted metal-dependent phosphoesterase TrpH